MFAFDRVFIIDPLDVVVFDVPGIEVHDVRGWVVPVPPVVSEVMPERAVTVSAKPTDWDDPEVWSAIVTDGLVASNRAVVMSVALGFWVAVGPLMSVLEPVDSVVSLRTELNVKQKRRVKNTAKERIAVIIINNEKYEKENRADGSLFI